jgi:hypothetical protein
MSRCKGFILVIWPSTTSEAASSLGKAQVLDVFHLSPSRRNVWLCETWVVNEVQVNIFNAELSQSGRVSH